VVKKRALISGNAEGSGSSSKALDHEASRRRRKPTHDEAVSYRPRRYGGVEVQERTNRVQNVFGELGAEDLKVQGQPRTDRENVNHERSRHLDNDTLKHTGTT
jgi:hypothetical protein